MLKHVDTKEMMSEAKFFESYARWIDDKQRYETWDEAVDRVMNMHRTFYKIEKGSELDELVEFATKKYKQKTVLGAQRALQFGGDLIFKHHMRIYNCVSSYADRPAFFGEIFYVLLCGAGAGFSAQKHHVEKLPQIQDRKKSAKIHVVEDSIEGWASALDAIMSSYFVGGGKMPEYEGRRVYFDLSKVRPKGAPISGGFRAPGSEPLRRSLDRIEYLIQGRILRGESKLRPIDVYDICMHAADAVLAGGVRRSATICLFSPDDEDMLKAKTGNWFIDNPQRARSNNSAVIVRSEATKKQFYDIMSSVREFGEPGFLFVDSTEHTTNPCVEISMLPSYDGKSGWQGCNLTEINGSACDTEDSFYEACEAASIIGTLQAGYTDFMFLEPVSKQIFDREALLGVSVTGWMTNPKVLLDESIQREGARRVVSINERVAKLIGINAAARATCVKPSGNASVLLQCGSSGVHAEHAPRYLRHVQMTKDNPVAMLIKQTNPYMVEESSWSANKTDYAIAFPVIAKDDTLFKDEMHGVNLLRAVKSIQTNWVHGGRVKERCVDPTLSHNVSNTVVVKDEDWDKVTDYVFENRDSFAGISFLPYTGDKIYHQAPNAAVLTAEEIIQKHGDGAIFASGLIVDMYKGFNNLWEACQAVAFTRDDEQERLDSQKEWIRRYRKFAENYFDDDTQRAEMCLKDVELLYKWTKIQQNLESIDFVRQLTVFTETDIDTMGSIACVGGICEI